MIRVTLTLFLFSSSFTLKNPSSLDPLFRYNLKLNLIWNKQCPPLSLPASDPPLTLTVLLCYRDSILVTSYQQKREKSANAHLWSKPCFSKQGESHNSDLVSNGLYEYVLGTRHNFVDASRVAASYGFIDASRVTAVFFWHFLLRHRRFTSRVINVQLLKLVSTPICAHTAGDQTLHPCWRPTCPLPTQRLSSTNLLAVKLSPLSPVVILHPCCQPTSSLPTQRSSYLHPSC